MSTPTIKSGGIVQFLKYAAVGVLNTAVTLFVIFICKSVIGLNPYVSNAIGYVLGLLNSFLWNRSWVFTGHKGKMHHQALKFVVGFALCYGLQFLVVWLLTQSYFAQFEIVIFSLTVSGYGIATIIGNIVYTLANFAYNKLITFKA